MGKNWLRSPESLTGLIGGELLYEASMQSLLCLLCRQQHRESRKIHNQAKMFQEKVVEGDGT